jgi:c-di-GMP-binding flagellar brake protein YcgR
MNDTHVMFEVSSLPDDSQFLLHNKLEIVRTLRGLISHHEMVSAFFSEGRELLLTSVLHVDSDTDSVLLDYGSNSELNQKILLAERIIFVTSLEKVKVQWVGGAIAKDTWEGRDAFRIVLPSEMLRLQRREYFRLTTPVMNPLKCKIPASQGLSIEVALADISAGGIGVVISQPLGVGFEVGAVFPGCRVELPGIGTAEFTLEIRSTWEITMKNGAKSLRAGCQFVDMRPGMQALIQRYIIKLERERIAASASDRG